MNDQTNIVKKECPPEVHQFLNTWKLSLQEGDCQKYQPYWIVDDANEFFGFLPQDKPHSLFLGTFPVPETVTSGFFYHSDLNSFWIILEIISGTDLRSLQQKLEFLTMHGFGITDIIREAKRTDDKCMARADSKLSILKLNNLKNLLNRFPSIKPIYLTSGGPKSKSLRGSHAGGWLAQQLQVGSIPFIVVPRGGAKVDIKSAKQGIDEVKPRDVHEIAYWMIITMEAIS